MIQNSTNDINKLHKDYTTPEQSQKLLELGVPASSANLYYYDLGIGFIYIPDIVEGKEDFTDPRYLPAWTTGRLMYILNMCVQPTAYRMLIYMGLKLYLITEFTEVMMIVFEELVKRDFINFDRLEKL